MKFPPWLAVLILLIPVSPLFASPEPIGIVLRVVGTPQVMRDGERSRVETQQPVREGDVFITTGGEHLLVRFQDNTRIAIGSDSHFTVHRYRFNAEQANADVQLELLKGALRTVTGIIGELPEPKLEVVTPNGTIGIRGTDFWGGYLEPDVLDVAMISGKGIYVENRAGRVEINEPGNGITLPSANTMGRVKEWPSAKLQRAARQTYLIP